MIKYSFSLLNVDHVALNERWNYKNVISPYCRIYYIPEGSGELSDQYKTLIFEPGYLYIIPAFTLCSFKCYDRLNQYYIHFFEESFGGVSLFNNRRSTDKVKASQLDEALFSRLLEINPERGINRSDNPKIYEKDIFYREYQRYNEQQTIAGYLETQGIISQLVARFLNTAGRENQKQTPIPDKIADTLNYIAINLHQDLSVAQLASRVNQNADYFSRLFKLHTGSRPANYINQKRVERAQYLMASSSLSFLEISEQTGFDNVSYFSKIFKKIAGVTPGGYKKQMFLPL